MSSNKKAESDQYVMGARCVCGEKFVHVARYPESNNNKDITEDFAKNKRDGRIVEILSADTKFSLCGESTCANAVGKTLTPKEQPEEIKEVLNFPVFKAQLLIFLKQQFKACDTFLDDIMDCEDAGAIRRVAMVQGEEIAEKLDVELDCNACDKKDRKISMLESEVSELEDKVETLETETSIPYGYKREAFENHQSKYNFMDFESLMEKGHQLLPMIN